jgi:PPK2 family polyphosphate:nucleotide phosphotransferase
LSSLPKDFRLPPGQRVRLKHLDPGFTAGFGAKEEAGKLLEQGIKRMRAAQHRLYAEDRHAVLIILQAMDAAGKDSTIAHVMAGLNPLGCQAYSFKTPSTEELEHDFLWRTNRNLPARGRIGIFNRSYYEEVLVVRVHPEVLANEKLPPGLVTKEIWQERFEDINCFERYLTRQGTLILKFFLNVSKEEQRKRFLARLDKPQKHWKFSPADIFERRYWDSYVLVYEEMLSHTSTKVAPWYVIPADHKWFSRLAVAEAIVGRLEELGCEYPKLSKAQRAALKAARRALEAEKA